MEKLKKWHFYLSFIALGLLACLFTSAPVEALGVTGASSLYLESGALEKTQTYGQTDNVGFTIINTFNKSGNDLWVTIGDPSTFDHVSLITKETIPANSIVSFVVRYQVQNNGSLNFNYYGVNFVAGRSLLNDSCVVNNLNTSTGAIGMNQMECTYTYYNASATNIIDWAYGHHVMEWALGGSQQGSNGAFNIVVGAPSYITLTNDGLSASDRAWLESVIPDATSVGQIEQGVKDAMDDVEDEQQSKYEQQSEDNEDDINADSSAAQSTASSLTSVLTQFLGILTSAQPTSCVLNGDLMPHLPLGQLDLCQNSPPAAITALGSLVLIAFVVPLAYHLVKRMLALIGSFQS